MQTQALTPSQIRELVDRRVKERTPAPALTIAQFIDHYGVSRNTVYEEIKSGRLASYQVGRRRYISARAADEWQRRLEVEAAGGNGFIDLNAEPVSLY